MKRKTTILLTVALTLLLGACGQKKGDKQEGVVLYDTLNVTNITIAPEYFFSGDFVYMADAAILKEVVSGASIPVSMTEHFLEAEKQYTALKLEMGTSAYAEFRGYLKEKGADEEGADKQLVITQVLTMDASKKSTPVTKLTGIYTAAGIQLYLNADHSYESSSLNGKDEKGKWFLADKTILTLTTPEGHRIMDVNYLMTELHERGGSRSVYRKK